MGELSLFFLLVLLPGASVWTACLLLCSFNPETICPKEGGGGATELCNSLTLFTWSCHNENWAWGCHKGIKNSVIRKYFYWGAGIAQWLECQTWGWKVTGSSLCRSSRRIFLLQSQLLCWLLFQYMFFSCVTTVACKTKRSRLFCRKCRWQVTAKHACTLQCGFAWSDVVVWCTQNVPRWQQFLVASAVSAL